LSARRVAETALSPLALLLEKPSAPNALGALPKVPSKVHVPAYSRGQYERGDSGVETRASWAGM
jgi:hypothetical protein